MELWLVVYTVEKKTLTVATYLDVELFEILTAGDSVGYTYESRLDRV